MSLQEKIQTWVEEVKKILSEQPEQTWISVPFLQSRLTCSFSHGLMIRDALIKEGVIEAEADGNHYNLTEAYLKSRPTVETTATEAPAEAPALAEEHPMEESIATPPTTEPPKKTSTRRQPKEKRATIPPLSDDDMISYALAISHTESKIFNQILIHARMDRPGGENSTLDSVSEEERPRLRDLLRMEANGLISCEKDGFVLSINRRSGVLIYQTCQYIESSSIDKISFIKTLLKKISRSTEEFKAFVQTYDEKGMAACGESVSTFDWNKFDLFQEASASLISSAPQEEAPAETTAQENATDSAVNPSESTPAATSESSTTATTDTPPITTPLSTESDTRKEQPAPPSSPRIAPTQLSVATYTQEQIQKYKDPEAVNAFCMHIWHNMLLHLCVKGFNDITSKYLPMLAEKKVLPPSLAAYLEAHEITPQTPCLPLCANDIQTSLSEYGLFALLEMLKENPDMTRTQAMDIVVERVRSLRNTYLLSNEAIDSLQSVRTALRNSSDEAFEDFKKMI